MIAKQIKGKDFYGVLAYNEKRSAKEWVMYWIPILPMENPLI